MSRKDKMFARLAEEHAQAQAEIARLTAEVERLTEACGAHHVAAMNEAGLRMKAETERDTIAADAFEAAAVLCWSKRDLLADAEQKAVAGGLTGRDYYGRRLEAELMSRAIRALTPADAKAALEARDRVKLAEGMREAAGIARGCPDSHWGPWCADAILARAAEVEAGK